MILKEILEQTYQPLHKQTTRTFETLLSIAACLDESAIASQLQQCQERLASDTFNILVLGRLANGKSTLLQALGLSEIGMLFTGLRQRAAFPVLSIRAAHTPFIRAWNFDETYDEGSLESFRARLASPAGKTYLGSIRELELGSTAELLPTGVAFIRLPRMDTDTIAQEVAKRCDVAIAVYRSNILAGTEELQHVREIINIGLPHLFSVVNLWHGREVDATLKGFVWHKLVTKLHAGPEYAGQDFSGEDIYFVDCLRALAGQSADDMQAVEKAGLHALESGLGAFLVRRRLTFHLARFISPATQAVQDLAQRITQRMNQIPKDHHALPSLQKLYSDTQVCLQTLRIIAEQNRLSIPVVAVASSPINHNAQ